MLHRISIQVKLILPARGINAAGLIYYGLNCKMDRQTGDLCA
jgi:hypothetical protein